MDGRQTIEFHREALLRLVMAMFVSAGMQPGGAPMARLPKPIRCLIARVLLPAESATKRLILFLSNRLTLPAKKDGSGARRKAANSDAKSRSRSPAPSFWLFDRRKFFPELSDKTRRVPRGRGPQITDIFGSPRRREPDPVAAPRNPDDSVRLCRRMLALYRALNDLDGQAMRLLRVMAKRKQAKRGKARYGPMRPGFPPGYRRNKTHEVDDILYECHMMAWFDRPPALDSS